MVCNRCVMVVKDTLTDMGQRAHVDLGAITMETTAEQMDTVQLQARLAIHGFSLLEDGKAKIVKQLKDLVAEVYSGTFDFPDQFRFAVLVKERLHKEYDTVRDIFMASERKTMEQYIIAFRTHKVKALLVHGVSLSDIAYRLNFTGVSHVSAQFKQQTGFSPSAFREMRKNVEIGN